MAKLAFLLGAGAGYVLGARAGRKRYEQMRARAQRVWQSQPVQDKVTTAKHVAKDKAAPAARDAVGSVAAAAGAKVQESTHKIKDRTTNGSSPQLGEQQGPSTFPLGQGPDQPA